MGWVQLLLLGSLWFFICFITPAHSGTEEKLKQCNDKLVEQTKSLADIEKEQSRLKCELGQVSTTFDSMVQAVNMQKPGKILQKQLDNLLHELGNDPPGPVRNESTKPLINLVFLFDGSASMKTSEFKMNKMFIWEVIRKYKNASIQFAAVQFSDSPRTVFTFKDYKDNTAEKKLDEEAHMKALTNTHRAIDHVLVTLFNDVSSGVDPEATNILIIITDGTPTDFDNKNVIKRCDDQRIIRIVFGVGNVDMQRIARFASEPKEENTIEFKNESEPGGIFAKLQNKFNNIRESTKPLINLVFLFDGSASMKTSEFKMNKMFIWEVIKKYKNAPIQFAAVQFSDNPRTVFTFKDYKDNTAEKKLDEEPHMKTLTQTHRAIDHVLVNLFNDVSSGVDPEATNILIIITDGAPTDFDSKNVIKRCDDQRIIRIVFGVGNVNMQKIALFASEPKEENTIYKSEWGGIFAELQNIQQKVEQHLRFCGSLLARSVRLTDDYEDS